LAREIEAKPGAPIWGRDEAGQGYALELTAAGLKAIAVDEGSPDAIEPGEAPQPQAKNGASPDEGGPSGPSGAPRLTTARAISLTSRPDNEERTGIRFEKERVYGYSGGAKALPGRPLAPAIAPIRGSRR
jgi:hypothetical protein